MFELTDEQKEIVNYEGDQIVNAIAGSGKTATLVEYVKARPRDKRFIYLVYNKTAKLEAEKRFKSEGLFNVTVTTAHSLAWRKIVGPKEYETTFGFTVDEVVQLTGLQDKVASDRPELLYSIATSTLDYLNYYCNSAEFDLTFKWSDVVESQGKSSSPHLDDLIKASALILLKKMKYKEIPTTHDFYLKMYQATKPVLYFDYILFDEGQDASPVMLDIFLRQRGTVKVIVGDTHQSIYSWRYATNALVGLKDFKRFNLSCSWRFGSQIAQYANSVLKLKNLIGTEEDIVIKGERSDRPKDTSNCVISRSNISILGKVIGHLETRNYARLYFEGGLKSYSFSDGASLGDFYNLMLGKLTKIRNPIIKSMETMEKLGEYIELVDNREWKQAVQIVKQYKGAIFSLIKDMRDKETPTKSLANMSYTSAHKSKGLEYTHVELADSFITVDKLQESIELYGTYDADGNLTLPDPVRNDLNEEINILYVAVTRAMWRIKLPQSIKDTIKTINTIFPDVNNV